jgi:hypothetical protein
MIRFGFLRGFGTVNLWLSLAWGTTIVCGLVLLLNYGTRPGLSPTPPGNWPADSALSFSETTPTVIMFTHPHCPCTRSSLAELERVISNCEDRAAFNVVAFEPIDAPDEWFNSPIAEKAQEILGHEVHWDADGCEARRFRVRTSGHVVAYGSDGQLIFSGGVTGSRGHEGSNSGRDKLTAQIQTSAVDDEQTGPSSFPVYGCSLVDGSEMTDDARQ